MSRFITIFAALQIGMCAQLGGLLGGNTFSVSKTYQPKDENGKPVGMPIKFTIFVETPEGLGIPAVNQK